VKDSDDRLCRSLNLQSLTEDLRITVQPLPPEMIADENYWMMSTPRRSAIGHRRRSVNNSEDRGLIPA